MKTSDIIKRLKNAKASVLIVFDENKYVQDLSLFLIKNRYKVNVVDSLNDAVLALKQDSYDIILSSTIFDNKDGFSMFDIRDEYQHSSKLFMISEKPKYTECVYAIKTGADNYIDIKMPFIELLHEIKISIDYFQNTKEKVNLLYIGNVEEFKDYTSVLEKEYSMNFAKDTQEAEALFLQHKYDLIIINISDKPESSFEFLRKIKYKRADIEFILLTKKIITKEAITAMRLGAYDYLDQKSDIKTVLSTVNNAITRQINKRKHKVHNFTSVVVDSTPQGFIKYEGYRTIRTLGAGSSGLVLLVEKDNTQYAMKLFRCRKTEKINYAKRQQRFLREAKILAGLENDSIIKVYESGLTKEEGIPFMIMEYIEGHSLSSYIYEENLSISERLDVLIQIAVSLKELHYEKIIHRDIKADNILITGDLKAKITDFGISYKENITVILDDEMAGAGTPRYMAPECFIKNHEISYSADLFSLAVLCYETLTGIYPFDGSSIPEIVNEIFHKKPVKIKEYLSDAPLELETFFKKALEKDPKQRYNSAGDMAQVLIRVKRYYDMLELEKDEKNIDILEGKLEN